MTYRHSDRNCCNCPDEIGATDLRSELIWCDRVDSSMPSSTVPRGSRASISHQSHQFRIPTLAVRSACGSCHCLLVTLDPYGEIHAAVHEVNRCFAVEDHVLPFHCPRGLVGVELEDGRTLADVRAVFRGDRHDGSRPVQFDWSGLHVVLEALPEGRWTTGGNLAEIVGTTAQAVNEHMLRCTQCANVNRVLDHDGRIGGAPVEAGSGARPDPSLVLDGDALAELLEDARATTG